MRRDNPDISEAELEASVALMRSQGVIDSSDAVTVGIGAMNLARIGHFLASMVQAGLYSAGEIDPARVATPQFVNRGVGLDLKRRLMARR
jgi:NitT/TauT family transport system substrate-binding protein